MCVCVCVGMCVGMYVGVYMWVCMYVCIMYIMYMYRVTWPEIFGVLTFGEGVGLGVFALDLAL